MKRGMTSRERVMACFNHEEIDRAAVINPTSVATVENMEITQAWFPDAHMNPDKMAALAAAGHEILGFDTVAPYFSVHQEAAALGCNVDWGKNDAMPTLSGSIINYPDEFKIPKNFLDTKPIKTVLEAIKLLRKRYKSDVAIIGKVMGPWTLSYNLHGVQDFLIETILEPEKVHGFLQAFKKVSLTFAEAQFEAGADIITWADHATGDLISSKGYLEFLFPVHKSITRELKSMGPVILHTCGNTLDRMQYFADTGFSAFHFDSRNDPAKAISIVKDKILLTGCINNPLTLLNGSTQDVRREVYQALHAGIKLISPECAVPCKASNKNLKAIVDSVKEFYRSEQKGAYENQYV
jgi:methyltransferase, MtaA/CmuA family